MNKTIIDSIKKDSVIIYDANRISFELNSLPTLNIQTIFCYIDFSKEQAIESSMIIVAFTEKGTINVIADYPMWSKQKLIDWAKQQLLDAVTNNHLA